MVCPHCNSPRHLLCAAGIKVNVDLITAMEARSTLSAALLHETHIHLLGSDDALTDERQPDILVVLPISSDSGLGDYGRLLLGECAPTLVKNGHIDVPGFTGLEGQIHQLQLPQERKSYRGRLDILLIGTGPEGNCGQFQLCGLVGSAIESAVSGCYRHIILALGDSRATISGRELGAVVRCRLSLAIVEDSADVVLDRITLIAGENAVSSLCQDIEVAGPLCSSCSHPHLGFLNLSRKKAGAVND